MKNSTLETLAWVLLYGGLLLLCLAAFVFRGGDAAHLGWMLVAAGGAGTAAGIGAIWWRSRRGDAPDKQLPN
jgi:O-antigen/teichoic acid export membrane protein